MQITYPHPLLSKLYKSIKPEEKSDPFLATITKQISHVDELLAKGMPWYKISDILQITRSTYYRKKKLFLTYGAIALMPRSKAPHRKRISRFGKEFSDLVLKIRQENQTYGKEKIAAIIKRDHSSYAMSHSTVGRILTKLKKDGKITRSVSCFRTKRKRRFDSQHAKQWKYGMKSKAAGELIQIDHATITKNGITVKHFAAIDPKTKIIVAEIYSNATSNSASKFLDKLFAELPYPVRSIQTDGGSEFMLHFEENLAKRGVPLYILPPNRPQYNGCVERSNRTFREEFYETSRLLADSVGAMRYELKIMLWKYNNYRPHHSLQLRTPMEYCKNILELYGKSQM